MVERRNRKCRQIILQSVDHGTSRRNIMFTHLLPFHLVNLTFEKSFKIPPKTKNIYADEYGGIKIYGILESYLIKDSFKSLTRGFKTYFQRNRSIILSIANYVIKWRCLFSRPDKILFTKLTYKCIGMYIIEFYVFSIDSYNEWAMLTILNFSKSKL